MCLSINFCPEERKKSSSVNVIYADGTEAHSYEECKPLVNCEYEIRCPDGSCRELLENCPKANTCPKNEIRCDNGSCAKDKIYVLF